MTRLEYRWGAANTEELRKIGEWMNIAHPIDEDADGDRIISAADEIDRLRTGIANLKGRCLWDPDLSISDILNGLYELGAK